MSTSRTVHACSGLFTEMVLRMRTPNEMFEFFARVFDIVHLKMQPEILDVDAATDVVVRICQCVYPALTSSQMRILLHDDDAQRMAVGYDHEWKEYYVQRWHVMQSIFAHIDSSVTRKTSIYIK